jgi:hypothetical protein
MCHRYSSVKKSTARSNLQRVVPKGFRLIGENDLGIGSEYLASESDHYFLARNMNEARAAVSTIPYIRQFLAHLSCSRYHLDGIAR